MIAACEFLGDLGVTVILKMVLDVLFPHRIFCVNIAFFSSNCAGPIDLLLISKKKKSIFHCVILKVSIRYL